MKKISRNQKGFTVIEGLLIVFILVVIGAVGYMVYKSYHKTITSSASKANNSSDNTSTASRWLPYTNTNGNFSAYFPTSPNFPKTPAVTSNSVTKTINGVNVTLNSVVSSNNINTTYDIVYITYPGNAKLPDLSSIFPEYQSIHFVSSKATTINGKNAETYELIATRTARRITVLGRQETLPAVQVNDTGEFVVKGNVVYEIDAVHNGNTPANNAQYFLKNFKMGN